MTRDPIRSRVWLGYLAIATGLAFHKWSLEQLLATDGHIASRVFAAIIVLFQLAWISLGVGLIWSRSRVRLPPMATQVAGTLMLGFLAMGIYGNLRALGVIDPYRERRVAWREISADEDLLLALTPELEKLGNSVGNLVLPDARGAELFDDVVVLRDLHDGKADERRLSADPVTVRDWQASGDEESVANDDLSLWRPLLDDVEYFEHARFKFIEGHFVDAPSDLYETKLHFAGLARTKNQQWSSIDVAQKVLWRRAEAGWRIAEWRTDRWSTRQAGERFFTEVLADTIVGADDLERARRSIHEEKVRDYLRDPERARASDPYFLPRAVDFHPGIAVVDPNRDGFDDLYVMPRWGPNLFLRNRGDGTFDEVASELGLDIEDHTSSAIFADFDNDGDADAFLGRTLAPSLYLVNENGRFVDRSATHVKGIMPCLTSSVSAVDYDADGLLDVYVSTFGAAMAPYLHGDSEELLADCLSAADRRAWKRLRSAKEHAIWNVAGPPNVMLRNLGGGRFETIRLMPDVYRNTFQSTWTDYDNDGDPDVYLANDYAPNNLLRNDGAGRFTDATMETGTADIGFGMGASWGDYDNDGRQDLYVTNMFSKAGRRIVRRMPQTDPRLPGMSRGNSLFKNVEGGFRKLSGLTPDTLQVENAGWSWGGQFADLNNDGFLDIYALSGYFTVPRPFEGPVDL